jgi:hypothetical protein
MSDNAAWDAFGSDEEEDVQEMETPQNMAASAVALFLSQAFLKENMHIKLNERIVGLVAGDEDDSAMRASLEQRGIQVLVDFSSATDCDRLDALIVTQQDQLKQVVFERLLHGGILVTKEDQSVEIYSKELHAPASIYKSEGISLVGRTKQTVRVHASTCPWLPSSHSIAAEQERLQKATVAPSAHEVSQHRLTESSIQSAVHSLKTCGYCVIRSLLDPTECQTWGKAVLDSVHDAANILLERDQVDILHPQASKNEPQSYQELSMREDLRLDIRHGSHLSQLRQTEEQGNENLVIKASTRASGFLRGHESLLEIVRRTMNPKSGNLYRGNLGRYNFDGSGPDGSFQDLRVSPVGGIVSFPGAADQALHADTPHLFEHMDLLPAHYVNAFAPGTAFHEQVGGTAFVHGSHNLVFTATYCGETDDIKHSLVRPCISLGDVVLFDCRVLHFGLANTSSTKVERALLYTNMTQAWFHDPKNWDDRRRIFENSTAE